MGHNETLLWTLHDTASALSMTTNAFRKKKKELEAAGFPKPCEPTGRYIVADVRAWISNQRKIRDIRNDMRIDGGIGTEMPTSTRGVNYDRL
ncbi:MAG: hypothetical protein KJ731_21215 [Alphaproteobacteria bacterium]|nr:hypothetical protein [Alphaproteobacteria bacterium]MBU1280305.1 hypothetical protein [Alphaproteobacteria bacterium]MBU1573043.1 hypothetical protein [Alphaproteobacteria bacterium]MBU1830970.1 hypothetical protein [Alphaproteobacteria bacterium]MBU2080003.1 hypothetical protein [Alphaproteobacteria bacterium]